MLRPSAIGEMKYGWTEFAKKKLEKPEIKYTISPTQGGTAQGKGKLQWPEKMLTMKYSQAFFPSTEPSVIKLAGA